MVSHSLDMTLTFEAFAYRKVGIGSGTLKRPLALRRWLVSMERLVSGHFSVPLPIRNVIVIRKYIGWCMHLYSVRGLERSELGGSHGCPGRLWERFL